jgi:hypothetical protein
MTLLMLDYDPISVCDNHHLRRGDFFFKTFGAGVNDVGDPE